jgi:hypothetical protein
MNAINNHDSSVILPEVSRTRGFTDEQEQPPKNTEVQPGAFTPSNSFYTALKTKPLPVSVDEGFIQSAAITGATSADVANQHERKFYADEVHATKDKVFRRVRDDILDNIASGEAHEKNMQRKLDETRQYLNSPDQEQQHQPWTKRAKVLVTVMFILALTFIAAEVHNGMTFAMESGHDHLKNWWAALLFAIVPCMSLGVFLKLISLLFHTERGRRIFQFVLGIIGCAAAVAAVPVFALTYSGFASNPIDILTGQATATSFSPVKVIALQIFLCGLASASLLISAWGIIEQHCQPVKVENPAWRRIKQDLDKISDILRKDRELLGFVEGKIMHLESERDKLIHNAMRLFTALRLRHELRQQHAQELLAVSTNPNKK